MRYFLIIKETMGKDRSIEILDSTSERNIALDRLISLSDNWETEIVAGKCKVYMTTYVE